MPDKTEIPIAEQIVRRIVESSIRLQWTRHWNAIEAGEITEEEMVQDALNLALGDDTGCLDEEEINSDNIDLLYVQEAFSSLAHQLSQEKELNAALVEVCKMARDYGGPQHRGYRARLVTAAYAALRLSGGIDGTD